VFSCPGAGDMFEATDLYSARLSLGTSDRVLHRVPRTTRKGTTADISTGFPT